MAGTPGIQSAIQRRLGISDPRGPEGMMSRGTNVYRGGMPQAHIGGGNPNLGRPSTAPIDNGVGAAPSPSLTAYVGSLAPNAGSTDPTMNDSVLNLIKQRYGMGGA